MLLELLMRRAGEVVTRDMIAETVWDSEYNVFTNLIEVFVNRLRQKIDKDATHLADQYRPRRRLFDQAPG